MNSNDKFIELKNWCIKNNSLINDKIKFNSDKRVIYTDDKINPNENIFEISPKCIINSENIFELPFINKENSELFDDHEKLVITLLYNI